MRGLLVVGHGSRRDEANATVLELARTLAPPSGAHAGALASRGETGSSTPGTPVEPDPPGPAGGPDEPPPNEPAPNGPAPHGPAPHKPAPDEAAPDEAPPAWDAVEPAFLEVARPDIAEGYAALARAGCSEIIVHPFFLFDGNHTNRDIPGALTAAQARHPGTRWTLTAPLGLHPGVVHAVQARIADALRAPAEPPPV